MKYVIYLCAMSLMIFLPSVVKAQTNFDSRTVVQIRIWDSQTEQYISSGSGVSIGGGAILTNYHVAEDPIRNPNRYLPIICIQKGTLECSYGAHAYYQFGLQTSQEPTYVKDLDLAVIYIAWKLIDGDAIPLYELSMDQWSDLNVIDLSIYGYEMDDVKEGDAVQTLGFPAYSGDALTYSQGEVQDFRYDLYLMKGFNGVNAIGISAPIGHGSSGGAALDANGSLIGLTSLCYIGIANEEVCDHGYIIPVSAINWWWEQVLGKKVNSWFGYTSGAIPEETGKEALCLVAGKIYDKVSDQCRCDEGYEEDSSGECVFYIPSSSSVQTIKQCTDSEVLFGGQCITLDQGCQNNYGIHSKWTGEYDEEGRYLCGCVSGYEWDSNASTCIERSRCNWETGSVDYYGACITPNAYCTKTYGVYSQWTGENNGAYPICTCTSNTVMQDNQCVPFSTARSSEITDVKSTSASDVKSDYSLTDRLKGYILLQVESHGEAWYLDPITIKRYYMKDGPTAYQMMRSFGLGVSEADYAKIASGDGVLKKRLSGRIILRVEEHGEAYWIDPKDLSVRYLQNGDEAYRIMRLYSLGITDADLEKVPIEEMVAI